MPFAQIGQTELFYLDEPAQNQAPVSQIPVILVHGFASNHNVNWVETGWVRHLTRSGTRVIALDNRGHGQSQKFYSTDDYSLQTMAHDVVGLMDFLDVPKANLIGYSMGARITITICGLFADRVNKASIGGAGDAVRLERQGWDDVARALRADVVENGFTERGRVFRAFAERTGADRAALASCVMGVLDPISDSFLQTIQTRMLIAVGTEDDVAGEPHALSHKISGSEVLEQPGKDHMSAVGDRNWKEKIVSFFDL